MKHNHAFLLFNDKLNHHEQLTSLTNACQNKGWRITEDYTASDTVCYYSLDAMEVDDVFLLSLKQKRFFYIHRESIDTHNPSCKASKMFDWMAKNYQ